MVTVKDGIWPKGLYFAPPERCESQDNQALENEPTIPPGGQVDDADSQPTQPTYSNKLKESEPTMPPGAGSVLDARRPYSEKEVPFDGQPTLPPRRRAPLTKRPILPSKQKKVESPKVKSPSKPPPLKRVPMEAMPTLPPRRRVPFEAQPTMAPGQRSYGSGMSRKDFASTAAIWMISKSGIDYGPYAASKIKEELSSGEMKEDAILRNISTGKSAPALEFREFRAVIKAYYYKVEEKRAEEEMAHAENQLSRGKYVKLGGLLAVLVLGGVAAVLIPALKKPPKAVISPKLPDKIDKHGLAPSALVMKPDTLGKEPGIKSSNKKRRRYYTARRKARAQVENPAKAAPVLLPKAVYTVVERVEPAMPGRLDFSAPGAVDSVSKEEVREKAGQYIIKLKPCFTREISRVRGARGKYSVAFTILPSGRTSGYKFKGRGHVTERLMRCLRRKVGRFRFPGFKGIPIPVIYPLSIGKR